MPSWTSYDALRNDALNARNFFESEGKNDLRRNLFGVKLGAPINTQLFIFFAYDGIRAIPKRGEFGNLKRGQLRGPAAFQADLAITRTLFQTSKESKKFLSELKVEIFNIFNRKNFVNPPVTLPNALGTSATGDAIQPDVPFTREALA